MSARTRGALPPFGVKPRLDEIGKPVAERAGAGELHIAVGVDLARSAHQLRPDLLAVLVADAFADRDLAAPELGVDRLDIGEEGVGRERHLRQIDEMRRGPVGGLAPLLAAPRASEAAAVRKPAFRPMITLILMPPRLALSSASPISASVT